jgi:hypothetical protein
MPTRPRSWHRELVRWAAAHWCEVYPLDCRTYDGEVRRRTWPKGELCIPCRAQLCVERARKRQTRNAARARRKGGRR